MRAALVAVSFTSACGYTLLRGDRPFGASAIMLLPFREAAPVGVSPLVTEALSARLLAEGVQLVRAADHADAVLSGEVVDETWRLSPGAQAQAYQVTLRIRAKLVGKDGASKWESEVLVSDDFLTVSGGELDLLATEANRRRALVRMAERAAAELCEQMVMAGGHETS